jgi:hypothetical protein
MGMTLLRMRTATLAVLAWGTACGGNVVVDGMPDGSGGAGATSSSVTTTGAFGSSVVSVGVGGPGAVTVGVGGSSAVTAGVGGSSAVTVGVGGSSAVSTSATWMATSGTGSASTGAGGGDAWSMCMNFCETYTDACVGPGQCEGFCNESLSQAPQCNEGLALFFDCATSGSIDCSFVLERCQPFLAKYDECRANGRCTPLECFAARDRACSCKGSCPNAAFSVECVPDRGGATVCYCFVNGEQQAACQEFGQACDLAARCCEPFFDEFR